LRQAIGDRKPCGQESLPLDGAARKPTHRTLFHKPKMFAFCRRCFLMTGNKRASRGATQVSLLRVRSDAIFFEVIWQPVVGQPGVAGNLATQNLLP